LPTAVVGKSAEGVVFACVGKADGTYKISYEGGWELFSIGTHAVKYDKSKGHVSHTFRPFVFAYIKSESNKNLHDLVLPSLLRLVEGAGMPWFGTALDAWHAELRSMGPDHPSGLGGLLKEYEVLRLASACIDHCPAIAAMFNATGESDCPEIRE